MSRPGRYPADVRARALRRVRQLSGSSSSQWAAIATVAKELGVSAETLRRWVREDDRQPTGGRAGDPTAVELRRLQQENAVLRHAIELLRTPAARPPGLRGTAPAKNGTSVRTAGESAPKRR